MSNCVCWGPTESFLCVLSSQPWNLGPLCLFLRDVTFTLVRCPLPSFCKDDYYQHESHSGWFPALFNPSTRLSDARCISVHCPVSGIISAPRLVRPKLCVSGSWRVRWVFETTPGRSGWVNMFKIPFSFLCGLPCFFSLHCYFFPSNISERWRD